jgi:hypothetical protein
MIPVTEVSSTRYRLVSWPGGSSGALASRLLARFMLSGRCGGGRDQGRGGARRGVGRDRLQRPQSPALVGRRPAAGWRRPSPNSASSATSRPGNCAPAAAARWRTWPWTPATRSSPTSHVASRRRPAPPASRSTSATAGRTRAAKKSTSSCCWSSGCGACSSHRRPGQPRAAALRHLGVPVVLVDRAGPEDDWCSVSVDDVEGGHLAVTHLLEQDTSDRLRRGARLDRPGRRPAPGGTAALGRGTPGGRSRRPRDLGAHVAEGAGRRAPRRPARRAPADRSLLRQRPAGPRPAAEMTRQGLDVPATSPSWATTTSSRRRGRRPADLGRPAPAPAGSHRRRAAPERRGPAPGTSTGQCAPAGTGRADRP